MSKQKKSQNKFIQLLTLSILVLGIGTSVLLVQQKMYNSKAAVQAPPPPVCPAGQFFCGARAGCWVGGCVNTSGLTCSIWLDNYCRTQTPTPTQRPTPSPYSPIPETNPCPIKTKCQYYPRSGGRLYVRMDCENGQWEYSSDPHTCNPYLCATNCTNLPVLGYTTTGSSPDLVVPFCSDPTTFCDISKIESISPIKVTSTSNNFQESSKAVDGNLSTSWNSGKFAPQWIKIDLGKISTISKIKLTPSQSPNGKTTHKIYASSSLNNNSYGTLIHTFSQITSNSIAIEKSFSPTLTNIRYITIETTVSPSWVAWSEIEIFP